MFASMDYLNRKRLDIVRLRAISLCRIARVSGSKKFLQLNRSKKKKKVKL